MPRRHLKMGTLASISSCVSMIQKNFFTAKGNMELYVAAAARKANNAYNEMLTEKATVIQNSFRAHLWNLLMRAAVINNRARRISRCFRAYQCRMMFFHLLPRRKQRKAVVIQRAFKRLHAASVLAHKFKLRNALLLFSKCKRTFSAMKIQRCYKAHVAWLLWIKEQLLLYYQAQRSNTETVMASLRKIQLYWRKYYRPDWKVMYVSHVDADGLPVMKRGGWSMKQSLYSRHVLLVFRNEFRVIRMKYHRMAIRIQACIRPWLKRRAVKYHKSQIRKSNKIWAFVKKYFLRLAIYRRVQATTRRRVVAAGKIKRNLRISVLVKKIYLRTLSRKLLTDLETFRNLAVLLIQRLVRRKLKEYFMPLRIAGRLLLKKKRARLHVAFVQRVLERASRVCQKFGKGILIWNRIIRIITIQRRKLLEWRKTKKLQRFCRWVLCISRYNRVITEKYDRRLAEDIYSRHVTAANKIGRHWKRTRRELIHLADRFQIRKNTLMFQTRIIAERNHAEEEKRLAEEAKQRTETLLKETINAAWRQGSDISGLNYYYNYVTGETSWEAPENMTMKVDDNWIKQVDARGAIYYYNQTTEESRWLPPCTVCGVEAERWCSDCQGMNVMYITCS